MSKNLNAARDYFAQCKSYREDIEAQDLNSEFCLTASGFISVHDLQEIIISNGCLIVEITDSTIKAKKLYMA